MAARSSESSELLIKEFEKWQEETSSEAIFLLEVRRKYISFKMNCYFSMPNKTDSSKT